VNALEAFAALVRQPDVALGACCGQIARHLGHPDAVAISDAHLDDLAATVTHEAGRTDRDVDLEVVARTLFARREQGGLGFHGNVTDYHDVRNSLLPEVLRRRTGIPITLSIVVIEVARRLEVAAVGVGMPGHFLVGEPGSALGSPPVRWLDAFDGGRWLDRRGAVDRFRELHGPGPRFEPSYLDATPGLQVVARVLNNLIVVHQRTGDPSGRLRTLELRAQLPEVATAPGPAMELAQAYAAVGRYPEAITTLGAVRNQLDPARRGDLDRRLAELRARLN
jgi:regulator of sirC expression with transglutaminase-like and TPR domain